MPGFYLCYVCESEGSMQFILPIARLFIILGLVWPSSFISYRGSDLQPVRRDTIGIPDDTLPSIISRREAREKEVSTLKPALQPADYRLPDDSGRFLLPSPVVLAYPCLFLPSVFHIRSPPTTHLG